MPLLFALFAVSFALLSACSSLLAMRWRRTIRTIALPLFTLAGVAAVTSGFMVLIHPDSFSLILPFGLPWHNWHIRLDALAGLFLIIVGILSIAAGIHGRSYVHSLERGAESVVALGGFSALFLMGMLLVILADDALLFMIAWELMSLASYFLVAFQHEYAANRRAAFLYLLMAHIGGLLILISFGVLAAFADSQFTFTALRTAELSPLWASIAFTLALIGFGMKAGLVPLHAWLPEAHPVAPSHISALMSGAMLKVAVYGFVRSVFDLNGELQWQWGVVVLFIGSISALMGVLYALMQHDLKRLLAYHSVENLGIIFIGLGLSLLFLATGHYGLGTLALLAALYHSINHALFKGLLFLGAGAILHSTHERDLEQMGGLLRRMPWTGLWFLIGCLSISALPPFNGFISEWLTFQAALSAWQLESGVLRSVIPIAAAVLALTGALAAACFVKVYAVAFLGQARSRHVRRARPAPKGMRVAQGLLAILCIVLGVLPGPTLALLNQISAQLLGHGLPATSINNWLWLIPISNTTASYSAPLLVFALTLTIAALLWLLQRRFIRVRQRRCDAWDCGFIPPNAQMQYSATGFAQPIRRVFGGLFMIEESLNTRSSDGSWRYQLRVGDRAWGLFYLPLVHAVEAAARRVVRLQSGNVRVYLGWTLATLLLLLWLVS
ncbi:hydrogenase 4 subunit B [Thiospirillum jenense]|uniref:Hydrogenase 4 subunit B n=1 Tax=Thiospirillum jenense TaxID=1653858 RepID=A0A839H9C8_9GAMM|nr:hydrogenase 4 subunit B [Thiospirillum jenense]MBB1125120.1 hydrogenase 4 subunit B [Thiospirillum jenense]